MNKYQVSQKYYGVDMNYRNEFELLAEHFEMEGTTARFYRFTKGSNVSHLEEAYSHVVSVVKIDE